MFVGIVGSPAAHADTSNLHVGGNGLYIDVDGANGSGVNTNYGQTATVGDFQDVTLTGQPAITSAEILPFTVVDATGTDAGWKVTITVGDFSTGAPNNYAVPSDLDMSAPEVIGTDGQTITNDGTAWTIQGGTGGAFKTGLKTISAPTGGDTSSMGTFVISPQPLRLAIPTDTYAGDYTSTTSVVLASAP
jgi:hypothetical protein